MISDKACISPEAVSRTRGIMLFEGIVQIILGIVFLSSPGASLLLLVRFIGLYWLIRGIVFIIQTFEKESKGHRSWLVIAGILGIISGLIVLGHPLVSTLVGLGTIVLFLIIAGIVQGIVNISQSFREGAWYLVLGLLQVVLAVFLMFNPLVGIVTLPAILGSLLAIGGIFSIYYGLSFEKRLKMPICS